MAELRALLLTWLDPYLVGEVVVAWSGRLLGALAILLIGRWCLRALIGVATRAMRGVGVDDTLNFASGVMLVFFRPFKVGDQIDAAGVGGVVERIGIFNVVLKTPDNRVVNVPNSLVYSGAITNYNAESTRRIDLTIAIGYDADIPQAKSVIMAIVAAEARVAKVPAPEVAVQDVLDTAVTIAVRVCVDAADYGRVRGDLPERIKRALDKYSLSIPAAQRLLLPTLTASK